jgi:hypothetical protein
MTTVIVGKFRMFEIRERQAEAGVHVRFSRKTHRGACIAVVGHLPRNDLGALRLTHSVPVVPGKFNGRIVRLRARTLK